MCIISDKQENMVDKTTEVTAHDSTIIKKKHANTTIIQRLYPLVN